MIKRTYEIATETRPLLKLSPSAEQVYIEMYATAADVWLVGHQFSREHVLELRDTLDQILMDWFCDKEPSPQELYKKYLMQREFDLCKSGPIHIDPETVVGLGMGEDEREVESSSEQHDKDYLENLRRDTSKREFEKDVIEKARRST